MSKFPIYRLAESIARWRRTRDSVQALERLDDRMLADMGIARAEIYWVVRRGRDA
jgi:uncharacterized protein YjiS (DUF1127 family)